MPLLHPVIAPISMPPSPAPQLKRRRDEVDWLDRAPSPSTPAPAPASPASHWELRSTEIARQDNAEQQPGKREIKRRRLAPRALPPPQPAFTSSSTNPPSDQSSATVSSSAAVHSPYTQTELNEDKGRLPTPNGREMHEYSQINNLLHTLHTLRTHTSPGGSTPASTPTAFTSTQAREESPFHREHIGQQERDKGQVDAGYEATNRILGSLALERRRRLGSQQSEQEDNEDDDDEGDGDDQDAGGADDADGWDDDMDM